MNIAIIKHIGQGAPNKKYLFQVPSHARISKGTLVKLKTRVGESYGVLTRDSFEAEGDALDFIRQSFGVSKKGELSTVTAVYNETPVKDILPKSGADYDLRISTSTDDRYFTKYANFPVAFCAKRKDTGAYMVSPCVYTTSEGAMYLGTTDTASEISVGKNSGNIYVMETADGAPMFVEIDPATLEWTVEK